MLRSRQQENARRTKITAPLDSGVVLVLFSGMADGGRRFPRPWRAERMEGGWQVLDREGVVVARCYGRDDIHRLNPATLTADEARRLAAWIARLPELVSLARGDPPEGPPDPNRPPAWTPARRRAERTQ
jgi:hypothetical protein